MGSFMEKMGNFQKEYKNQCEEIKFWVQSILCLMYLALEDFFSMFDD